ncbi:MAG: flagellar hook protein FlgE [Rhodocyclaceae bacterium]|jgi:flagellar hook protein FlgE|nr:flagellar hook protein FlgE [Rhodocyclaceae bacterium]
MSFQQGLSGLNTSAKALDVVGNNIANANTVGFKTARAEFADVFAKSLSGSGASPVGAGAALATVAQQFTQGNITSTNSPLDLAINGGGFYMMSANGALTYSRNGQFQLDKEGFVIDAGQRRLQGYVPQDLGGPIVPSSPEDIFVDPSDLPPNITSEISMGVNLDSRSAPIDGLTNPFDRNNPLTYTASTSQSVFDSLGNPHVLSYYFVKTPTAAEWLVYGSVDGTSPAGVDFGAGFNAPANLTFTTGGAVATINGVPAAPVVNAAIDLTQVFTELNATVPIPVPALVNSAAATIPFATFDMTSLTQFGSPFGVNALNQNGYSSGRLAGLSVSSEGLVQGRYTNGQSRDLAQVTLARFTNPNGLVSLGGNQWQETDDSGQALIGVPGSGSNGLIKSAAVEEANVDLTAELVAMITLQRSYQANAQTIKTQDSILQTLVNLR